MSSPFPIPNLGSSPFLFPLPQIAQLSPQAHVQAQAQVQGTGNTPAAAPIFAPSPLSQLISSAIPNLPVGTTNNITAPTATVTGFTPSAASALLQQNPLGSGVSASPAFQGVTPNTSALLAAVGVTPGQIQLTQTQHNLISNNPHSQAQEQGQGQGQAQQLSHNLSQAQYQHLRGGHTGSGGGGSGGAGAGAGAGAAGQKQEIGLQQVIRSMGDTENLLARAEVVLAEIKEIEGRVFDASRRKDGDSERLLYGQIIQTVLLLSQSSLFGALPVLFGAPSASTTTASIPTKDSNDAMQNQPQISQNRVSMSTGTPTAGAQPVIVPTAEPQISLPTITDLIDWAEKRAALEFGRREALKAGSKAVVDILKASANASASGTGSGVGSVAVAGAGAAAK
ncbi:hypothetical protein IAU59_001785 [Kwoniella sp. CBS 9459]